MSKTVTYPILGAIFALDGLVALRQANEDYLPPSVL